MVDTLVALSGVKRGQVKEVIERYAGEEDEIKPRSPRKAPSCTAMPPGAKEGLSDRHAEYLLARGFSNPATTAEIWGLWSTKQSTNGWSWRIVLPFYRTSRGEILAAQGRSISPSCATRYTTTEDEDSIIPAKHLLYGEWLLKSRRHIVVCEGPIDAMKLGPGAIALCGKAWTREQLSRLSRYEKRSICFDFDEDSYYSATRLAETLHALDGKECEVWGCDEKKDAGDLTEEEAQEFMKEFGK